MMIVMDRRMEKEYDAMYLDAFPLVVLVFLAISGQGVQDGGWL